MTKQIQWPFLALAIIIMISAMGIVWWQAFLVAILAGTSITISKD